MYQYSLLKQQNMLGTCPKHTWWHINTHTFLSFLLALFLCFLSRLWCRTFRFLHLFIGFVISGLRLLLERKHRIYNNKETVREEIIMSKDDAFEKYLLLLYLDTIVKVSLSMKLMLSYDMVFMIFVCAFSVTIQDFPWHVSTNCCQS